MNISLLSEASLKDMLYIDESEHFDAITALVDEVLRLRKISTDHYASLDIAKKALTMIEDSVVNMDNQADSTKPKLNPL